jgi:hypothetical protein
MSLIGILASNLFASGAAQNPQNAQNPQSATGTPSNFQQLKTEFQQLGQDLQSGNLTQAQQDYATLSQNVPSSGATAANPALQAFSQLGQDLQAGNLQAAQQDYATVQQDAQQQAAQVTGHHGRHHHHSESSQSSSASSSSRRSQRSARTCRREISPARRRPSPRCKTISSRSADSSRPGRGIPAVPMALSQRQAPPR